MTESDRESKTPSVSKTVMTEMVMPNDTNNLDNLMGGNLLRWMDICSAIAAGKHAGKVAVTASVDNVSFRHAIRAGQIVTLCAWVTRAFNTSMEVYIEVNTEELGSDEKTLTNTAYYTFVALDGNRKPIKVQAILPETEVEKKQFEGAMRRRELRLLLAGRIKVEDTTSLKSLFQ
jgi:acyl-CoA hydrolase